MGAIDWTIISVYLIALIALSAFWGRGQKNPADYYVGGRKLPWWAVAISTMATQTSAISFISIPAYVALKQGGGLTWIQYELAVPLAMIAVIAFLIPFFRQLELITVYEYLELRFGPSIRSLISGVFLLSRGLSTGVAVYAAAIVLAVALRKPLWFTILLIGLATVIYDTLGGMRAVVYSDVIQMGILVTGLLVCIAFAIDHVGSLSQIFATFPADRWRTIDWSLGMGDRATTPFWAFLLGGFFLYLSYYGVDQSQAQRELSAPTVDECKKSLIFNGLARFPLTLLYLFLGIAAGAVFIHSPELQSAVPPDRPDYLIPEFILYKLPVGARGLLIAALLAAAMSSLDSALNSLSAVTIRDFIEKYTPKLSEKRLLFWSKFTTVCWGAFMTAFAFWVGTISETVIEAINKIGSAFYGPILAAFMGGVLIKRVNVGGMIWGIIFGVGVNLALWLANAPVHWMWWNLIGFVASILAAFVCSRFFLAPAPAQIQKYMLSKTDFMHQTRNHSFSYIFLAGYFGLMLVVAYFLMYLF